MDLRALCGLGHPLGHVRCPSNQGADQGPRKQAHEEGAQTSRGAPTHVLVVQGSNTGATAPLSGAPILIGRGSDAAIKLEDDYVSTRHARIAASGDQWFVEDLGSTNGTYLGASRISQPTAIAIGTQVRIGKTILELRK